jgi:hypothetical protein
MILPPVSNKRVVDFGAGIGRRSVYLYNLPEVTSGHQARAVPCLPCLPATVHLGLPVCCLLSCQAYNQPLLLPLPLLAQVFGVPSISARFGTAPDIWNLGMVAMARLAPKSEWARGGERRS